MLPSASTRWFVAALSIVLFVFAVWGCPHVDGAVRDPRFVPPVDAPITDPFRPPSHPYGPGNRGLEYGTRAGQVVRASGDGTVVFAGPVGGRLYITIDHGGGLRTTYSWLLALKTRRGERVERGRIIGVAADVFHFGARRHGVYIDPMLLFGSPVVRVRLVPLVVPR